MTRERYAACTRREGYLADVGADRADRIVVGERARALRTVPRPRALVITKKLRLLVL